MSYETSGDSVTYTDINDLPENSSINDGDKFIVQTDSGTVLVDYSSIRIDMRHTTFGDNLQEVITFTTTATRFFSQAEQEISDMQTSITSFEKQLGTIECKLNILKSIISSLIWGYSNNGSSTLSEDVQQYITDNDDASDYYTAIIQSNGETYYPSFTNHNFVSIASNMSQE